jgi:hypothetical protein
MGKPIFRQAEELAQKTAERRKPKQVPRLHATDIWQTGLHPQQSHVIPRPFALTRHPSVSGFSFQKPLKMINLN